MTIVYRPLGYTGSTQRLVINEYVKSPLIVHLWGGGGGGGSGDGYGRGGTGGGGGYSLASISVTAGDIIDVAVGGFGERGYTGGGGRGGIGGSSYDTGLIFNTRTTPSPVPVYPITLSPYCQFLNATGIWNTPNATGYSFNNSYTVNFPQTGVYRIEGSCDNYATVTIDGSTVLEIPNYHFSVSSLVTVTAGNHTVAFSAVNTGGPGSVGITITQVAGSSWCGGTGGRAGYAGGSGGGGGSGGATVVFKNNTVVAAAGGGGGGGGAGQYGYIPQCNAPGLAILASSGIYNGQNGQDKDGDGGGGGAGGGGYRAGDGGATRGGDDTAYGGANGGNYSISGSTQSPSGQTPGGTNDPYYIGGIGAGGNFGGYLGGGSFQSPTSGTSGYAVLEFTIAGLSVKNSGSWNAVSNVWTKVSGTWRPVNSVFVKQNGVWNQIQGQQSNVPVPSAVGLFGYSPREYPPPPPPPPDPGYSG